MHLLDCDSLPIQFPLHPSRRRKSIIDGRNRFSTAEMDRQRPILAAPPDSSRSTFRSAVGPVCTERYRSYRSIKKKRDDLLLTGTQSRFDLPRSDLHGLCGFQLWAVLVESERGNYHLFYPSKKTE
ncbi:hypothetical protein GW17_00051109 [Ensete ventricosum]|nr:hypothetical protein GW17_00051109 [Ensete ventricosum]